MRPPRRSFCFPRENKAQPKHQEGDASGTVIALLCICIFLCIAYYLCCREPAEGEDQGYMSFFCSELKESCGIKRKRNAVRQQQKTPPSSSPATDRGDTRRDSRAVDGIIARLEANDLTLRDVNLDNLSLNDDDATRLASALRKNTNVQYVKLRYNRIGDSGGTALREALAANSTVRRMSLAGNRFMDHALQVQIEKLSLNPSHRGDQDPARRQERAKQHFGTEDDMADSLTGGLAAQMRWRKLRNYVKAAAQFKNTGPGLAAIMEAAEAALPVVPGPASEAAGAATAAETAAAPAPAAANTKPEEDAAVVDGGEVPAAGEEEAAAAEKEEAPRAAEAPAKEEAALSSVRIFAASVVADVLGGRRMEI